MTRRLSPVPALAGILVAVLAACGSGDSVAVPRPTGTAPTTTAVETLPSLADEVAPDWFGEPVNLHDLTAGDCFNRYAWSNGERLIELDTKVPCDVPHQNEIYLHVQHPARTGAPWPGDEEMAAFAVSQCYDAFEDFVGVIYEVSELELGYLTPNRANFEHEKAQFRGVHCYVYDQDGEDLFGSAHGSLR